MNHRCAARTWRHGLAIVIVGCLGLVILEEAQAVRVRELGIAPGDLEPAALNAITDVAGVCIGHVTLVEGDATRTGVTAIVPHGGNLFAEKVPCALAVGNGFGKLIGATQIEELGQLETPILLTNTLAVWDAASALVERTLALPGNERVRSVNPVVGETNDGWLNAIRERALRAEHFHEALGVAKGGPVAEGSVGAGTGTTTFGFKGGIGTSSRRTREPAPGYVVGVLAQTNFDGRLAVDGVPVWRELRTSRSASRDDATRHGSCMIVVATDAPLDARQLKRVARRALVGMARTGANFSHGSGDYAIAFSTAESVRIKSEAASTLQTAAVVHEAHLTPLFEAAADATEEAIYNALLQATTVTGRDGHVAEALSVERLKEVLARYGRGSTD